MFKAFKYCKVLALLWVGAGLAGCDSRSANAAGHEKPAVTVNKLQLTQADLQEELKTRVVLPYGTEKSAGGNPDWLNQIIDREILVQEAQRLGLDRDRDFMKTIEHFWKQALIKQLVIQKGREINAGLHIYEPQIEAYYKKLAQEKGGAVEPLAVLRKDIIRTLEQEAADKAMDEWLTDLKKKAQISVDQEALKALDRV